MPYIKALKVLQTGNTSAGIFETMTLLLNLNKDMHRVSFVRDHMGSRLSVGDSLELASQATGKLRKKRWWEQEKKAEQLRLPFSLYKPARIIHVSYDGSGCQIKLKLRFMNEGGEERNRTLCHDGLSPLADFAVKAVRVHAVIKKWVEPSEEAGAPSFLDCASLTRAQNSEQQPNLSHEDCVELIERATQNGIVVTPSGKVYNAESGAFLGTDLRLATEVVRDVFSASGVRGDLIMPNAVPYSFQIQSSKITYIDRETYAGSAAAVREERWCAMYAAYYGSYCPNWVNSSEELYRGTGE